MGACQRVIYQPVEHTAQAIGLNNDTIISCVHVVITLSVMMVTICPIRRLMVDNLVEYN